MHDEFMRDESVQDIDESQGNPLPSLDEEAVKSLRVVMIESQGQGGVCHYTFSLCTALAETQDAEVTLVTGRPYELLDAPRSYALAPAFGPGLGRKAIQWTLRRPDLRSQAQPVLVTAPAGRPLRSGTGVGANAKTTPYRATSLAGRASRWLAEREAAQGWRRALRIATAGVKARMGEGASQKRPTVAHIQWLTDPDRDLRWIEALRVRRIPVILTAHNVLPHDASLESRWIWARVYDAVDGIIVHYQRALDDLYDLEIDVHKVIVIPHGNYTAIQALTEGTQRAWDAIDVDNRRLDARRRLGLPADAPVVLCFGLMRPYKGIQVLLPAFATVRHAAPDARLILAGGAPDGFAAIQAEISRLGLDEAIVSLPTYLPLEVAAEVFEACDVVALPYVEASQSGVVQLAYAYSRPVVATRVGGIPDAVNHGETGILVDPQNPEQLTHAMMALLSNREHCAHLGAQARQFAMEHFAWEPIAGQTIALYKRALAGWPWGTGALSRDDLRSLG